MFFLICSTHAGEAFVSKALKGIRGNYSFPLEIVLLIYNFFLLVFQQVTLSAELALMPGAADCTKPSA